MDFKEKIEFVTNARIPLKLKTLEKQYMEFLQINNIDPNNEKEINKALNNYSNRLRNTPFHLIKSDIKIELKNTKTFVLFNIDSRSFQFQTTKNFIANPFLSRDYTIDEIISFELYIEDQTEIKNDRSMVKTVAGGLLFGPIGAIAGSLSGGSSHKKKYKAEYVLKLHLEDIELTYVELKCKNRENAYRLLTTFKLWEEKIRASTRNT